MKCIILGAGASAGYDDAFSPQDRVPTTNEFFSKGIKLGIFSEDQYPNLYSTLKAYLSIENSQKLTSSNTSINVELFLESLAMEFEKASEEIRSGNLNTKIKKFQTAIGESYYYIFELLRYYSIRNQPKLNNYSRLAAYAFLNDYSIISLNYDTILENSIEKIYCGYNYDSSNLQNYIPIAKIHGSINWLNPGGRGMSFGNSSDELFEIITGMIYTNQIEVDRPKNLNQMDLAKTKVRDLIRSGSDYDIPIIMPPIGKYKNFSYLRFSENIWKFANSLISNVMELVFIGTSIRDADQEFCDLIKNNVKKETKITIVGDVAGNKKRLSEILGFESNIVKEYSRFTEFAKTLPIVN